MLDTNNLEKNIVLNNNTESYNVCIIGVPKGTVGGFIIPAENAHNQLNDVFFAEYDVYFIGNDFNFAICDEGIVTTSNDNELLIISGKDHDGEFESFYITIIEISNDLDSNVLNNDYI